MKKIVQVPDLGDADEVEVIEVCVKKGDMISAEDPLIVLESEKAAMEVPSPDAGKIIDIKHIENNIKSRPDIILMHGDKDEVVPVSFLLEAKELFNRINYKIQTKIFQNCEHRIPQEGSSLGLEFIKKKLY